MYRIVWQENNQLAQELNADTYSFREKVKSAESPLFAGLETVGQPEAVFSQSQFSTHAKRLAAREIDIYPLGSSVLNFNHVFVKKKKEADELVTRLKSELPSSFPQLQTRPVPPIRKVASNINLVADYDAEENANVPDFVSYQEYLLAAPIGIDAYQAWTKPGGGGEGVKIIDIEYGWNLLHEDLLQNNGGLVYGINAAYEDHGTAVMGVIGADHNNIGVAGIAPYANCSASSIDYDGLRWNSANAIYNAVLKLNPGDIILLELQDLIPDSTGPEEYICMEYWEDDFAAIQYATSMGIVVVECAGNGSQNLDDPKFSYKFDRTSRDSGAIIVGAGGSSFGGRSREKMAWSNYGSRVDVQGWGEDVVTTGGNSEMYYSDLFYSHNSSKCYTKSFSGTSSAGAMVAGAAAALNGLLIAANKQPLNSFEMREVLNSTGTQQADATMAESIGNIGPLPDLAAAMQQLMIGQ